MNLALVVDDACLDRFLAELTKQGFPLPFGRVDDYTRPDVRQRNRTALQRAMFDTPLMARPTATAAPEPAAPAPGSLLLILAAHLEAGHELGPDGEWRTPTTRPWAGVRLARLVLAATARKIAVKSL